MHIAIVLTPATSDDPALLQGALEALRRVPGVLHLDESMAASGLVLVRLDRAERLPSISTVNGVEKVEGMGIRHAWLEATPAAG